MATPQPDLFHEPHVWTVTLHHNNDEPAATHVPIDDHDLAALIAPLFAAVTGQPTSVARAVHAHRHPT